MCLSNGLQVLTSIIVVLWSVKSTESLDCFSCNSVQNVTECKTTSQCAANENCYTKVIGQGSNISFALGCKSLQNCLAPQTTPQSNPAIVGRSSRDVNVDCDQCCANDYCNKKLCSQPTEVITNTDGRCHDDADYSCELVGSTFDICKDVNHAKTFCRKWCGLCGVVDGGWSVWSPWSPCDVTCATGQRTRSRSCTNPAPTVGGLNCSGDLSEISSCTLDTCPIHGNWSQWSAWGTCSVTCGVGLERRDRGCSMPTPGPHGNPCAGDAHEDRVCFIHSCADGHWSSWGSWSTCTSSCNGGMKSRSRDCTNPEPSQFGKYCHGDHTKYSTCNPQSCKDSIVYFTVTDRSTTLNHGHPTFSTIEANVGGGYNSASSQFVCPVSGLYHFYFTFVENPSSSAFVECYLRHNSHEIARAVAQTSTGTTQSASISAYVQLQKGDLVDIGACLNWQHIGSSKVTVFTGALIHTT